MVPVHRVSFWKGVRRDYLLRRRRVLKFLGKKRKRQLLRSLLSDPLPEGHPVDRDHFSVVDTEFFFSFCSVKPALANDPGVLWKKAPRAMRAMRGKTLETVPFQPYFGCTKSFFKVLSNEYCQAVTPLFRRTKAPKALVLLCFGAIREGG